MKVVQEVKDVVVSHVENIAQQVPVLFVQDGDEPVWESGVT